ncbi:MAG: hypothetical protein OHK0015_44340 [Chloroflexi bacterium OHK40]
MGTRIMVIDDEPLICTLLAHQLGGAGYQVSTFRRGYEALLRLATEPPDLILLDVMMPEISGWDLCRQIRASSNVPVIMLTAKHGDDDVVTGLTSGADDYVAKPFNQAQLVARIEAVLRRAQPQRGRAGGASTSQRPSTRPVVAPRAPQPPVAAVAVSQPPTPRATPAPPSLPRLGPRLAEARHQRGMSLYEAAQSAGVRWEFLQAIEQEEFSYVPRSELRAALRAYSSLLGVDLAPYAPGTHQRRARRPGPLSVTVGMAAILTLAIVLLTLAL